MDTGKEAGTLKPILNAHLFQRLEDQLLELLRSLQLEDWTRQTIAGSWTVKDVVAHMLDTQLRKLSFVRDGFRPQTASSGPPADLVKFVNGLNHEGVTMYGRLSSQVLISLMEVISRENSEFHQSLDPFANAAFAVSWAGDATSPNWFDTAREFTERWHHQQQIRLAVNKGGIMTPEFYHPVLDCFMRALPHHYRGLSRPSGTIAHFTISGDCGGEWYLWRDHEIWKLATVPQGPAQSHTVIPQEIAWRVFTKGISRDEAKAQVSVTGDLDLGLHVLDMVSIIG